MIEKTRVVPWGKKTHSISVVVFPTVYVFGFCFRMLPVILVSDVLLEKDVFC